METFKFIVTYTNDKRRVEVKAANYEDAIFMVHKRAEIARMLIVKIEKEGDDLKSKLLTIQTKMSEQTMGAWNGKLEDTDPVIITGDYHGNDFDDEVTLAYNGWAEDLDNLIKSL